jgi:hypothetical protein
MMLTPVIIVRLESVPVGIAVGVWMALLTNLPYCPVQGLGTRALCAARPMFAPGLCILCGVVAAALLIMVSLALPRPGRAALTSRMH